MKQNYLSFQLVLTASIAAMAGFLFGFDTSVVADIHAQATAQLALNNWQWSKVVSAAVLGALLGIVCSGFLSDRLSRRQILKQVALGFIIGTCLCATAESYAQLLAGRFMIGLCIGVASYLTPMYLAEIAPAGQRGQLVLFNGLALTLGQAAAYLLGYAIHDLWAYSWRIILLAGIVPALGLYLGLYFVPQSPRWLYARQGKAAALASLSALGYSQSDQARELTEMSKQQTIANGWALFKKPLCYVLLAGLCLGAFQQLSGINAILYYGPLIFAKAGIDSPKAALLATFILGLVNFVMTGVTLLLVDRLGRRTLLLAGTLLASLALYLVSLQCQFSGFFSPYSLVFSLCLYVLGYCVSLGSLFWLVIAEIYPLAVRGLAMSLATLVQWAANLLVAISFLGVYHGVGPANTFALFGFFCFLAFLFCYLFIPETMGVSLEQIEANLMSGLPLRDLGKRTELSPQGDPLEPSETL